MFSFTARSKTCVIFVKSDLSGILFGVKYLWTVLNKMAWYGFQKYDTNTEQITVESLYERVEYFKAVLVVASEFPDRYYTVGTYV